jgi:16S rRNA (guanine1207-N2)-methyltransferase
VPDPVSEPVSERARAAGAAGAAGAAQQAHYFATPAGRAEQRKVQVTLAGRDVEVVTADGVFSGGRLDLGTRVLLREVPPPPTADRLDLLDLGCGWGPLALTMGLLSPLARVWAVDVNERALALTRLNATRLKLTGVRACLPQDVPEEVRFAAIWSNPPIRVGKAELHRMLLHWLPRLTPDGAAYLVVQRHLGADSLHSWLQAELVEQLSVTRAGSAKGYRVLRLAR